VLISCFKRLCFFFRRLLTFASCFLLAVWRRASFPPGPPAVHLRKTTIEGGGERHGNRSPIDRAASQRKLARTTASQLDPPRPGYRPGQISGLGQEMARLTMLLTFTGLFRTGGRRHFSQAISVPPLWNGLHHGPVLCNKDQAGVSATGGTALVSAYRPTYLD